MVRFERFYAHNDLRNFSYLIFDEESGSSWVIDPWEARPFTEYIKKQGLTLKGILNTHQHWDHTRGNEELSKTFNAVIRNLGPSETIGLSEGHELEVLNAPGHTLDHQVFVWKSPASSPVLFSGDTLFNAGVGNCRNGGDVHLLFRTVQSLLSRLPLDTVLQPGHDYLKRNLEFALSVDPENKVIAERLREIDEDPLRRRALTLREEKELNPFLRLAENDEETFIKLRALRDKW